MIKIKLTILIALLSLSILKPSILSDRPSSFSFGVSETMGIVGFINVKYDIAKWSSASDQFYLTGGMLVLPFFGGAGVGWRHNFSDSRISQFTSLTTFGTYVLPIMCSTDNCKTKFGLMSSASVGINLHLLKSDRRNIHLQLGVFTQFDMINL
ncbi:MAG: hypothetical protein H8E72_09515 [Candidatus Marinimicrobia bacterium]|nr:hypothetical protein [Candidatus Neomarinimicrobiota bacterium]